MATPTREPPSELRFEPKSVTVLREGYGPTQLRADAVAGLTVAIVALPLSMAIAIASGVGPERGLFTAIAGGFLVSLLGGSRHQIGGPAGAFIVLVLATVQAHGLDGLILATLLSGAMMLGVGWLRLGAYVKYIPYPVTVGFTAGIAAIIFASQIKDLLGLALAAPEPGPFLPKLAALAEALPSARPWAAGVAALSAATVLGLRRLQPNWPGMLIAVVATSVLAAAAGLDIETIGSRFGGIPRSLPAPALPDLSWAKLVEILPAAISFALLGCIESLLSAVVADGMTGRRHRPNAELVAQGFANIGSALFGGFCVTGTIARTATNVRAGGRTPFAGMLHSAFLLGFMLLAAPLAAYIPLAALAGILAVVAWNMAERHQFATLLRASWGDATVVTATFLLVVLRDLTEGILVGFSLGALLFLNRMARAVEVDAADAPEQPIDGAADGAEIATYKISGAFFFAAAANVGLALDNIGERPRAYAIDLSDAMALDSTAAATLLGFARKAERRGAAVFLCGVNPAMRRALGAHGAEPPLVRYCADMADATRAARVHARAMDRPGTAERSAALPAR